MLLISHIVKLSWYFQLQDSVHRCVIALPLKITKLKQVRCEKDILNKVVLTFI